MTCYPQTRNIAKHYADGKDIRWGFLLNKDNQLYINNALFAIDISDECGISLEQKF